MTEEVPPAALSEIYLRLLCHDDIDTVKQLCSDWFPIEYPDSWYQDITSNQKFFSLAATYRGTIVGMIVAEIKSRAKVHKEDGDILASGFPVDTQVAYILSLGVVKEFRKHGIGSLLLESLKDHISTTAQDHCKAIYLHVLTTNNTAIHFYENRDFKQHHYLPYYYSIRGVLKDGFTYPDHVTRRESFSASLRLHSPHGSSHSNPQPLNVAFKRGLEVEEQLGMGKCPHARAQDAALLSLPLPWAPVGNCSGAPPQRKEALQYQLSFPTLALQLALQEEPFFGPGGLGRSCGGGVGETEEKSFGKETREGDLQASPVLLMAGKLCLWLAAWSSAVPYRVWSSMKMLLFAPSRGAGCAAKGKLAYENLRVLQAELALRRGPPSFP
ncbi:N-alpha-acetyltransferase 60 [Crotalus adamanteus]|uniref:N-alpha-acetyltransferase 60 n=1 Tax=Crotalus adamanteus TaxID=8729 RepID=A0AAW1ATZ4_CROAD